ncbi:Thivi_2564 family membrane protein [Bosea sp. TWI1241]|uniref:Thivi_2564 family membrane protein n=1 Tax=Bosea sp. TWI1241 TaxID=3148904 RepID=UPI00320A676D
MNILISLFITVLVIGLVLYLVRMLPLDGNIKNVLQIIVIIIGIISLLRYLAVF